MSQNMACLSNDDDDNSVDYFNLRQIFGKFIVLSWEVKEA